MGEKIYVEHNRRYTKQHLWIKADSEELRIGITDYAQKALKKKAALVEFKKKTGDAVEEEEIFCVVYGEVYSDLAYHKTLQYECMAFDVISPVKGRIVEVNQAVMDKPQLVNDDCYGRGWLALIKPENGGSVNKLLEPDKYVKSFEKERNPLRVF